jgi:tol-pal system protein YbgF
LQTASDSLAQVSARTVNIQGDVRGETRAIKEQLLQIQQLLGQSQATIARLRAELAERTSAMPMAPTVPPTGTVPPTATGAGNAPTTTPGATTAPVTPARIPSSSELYQSGRDQLTRGSSTTARILFQDLLTNYPNAEEAPDAQFWIAESFSREKQVAAADAAYAAVVSKYPNAPKAPTAVYKRAMLFLQQNNSAKARELFEQVIARYPRSDEAVTAADQLKTLR